MRSKKTREKRLITDVAMISRGKDLFRREEISLWTLSVMYIIMYKCIHHWANVLAMARGRRRSLGNSGGYRNSNFINLLLEKSSKMKRHLPTFIWKVIVGCVRVKDVVEVAPEDSRIG